MYQPRYHVSSARGGVSYWVYRSDKLLDVNNFILLLGVLFHLIGLLLAPGLDVPVLFRLVSHCPENTPHEAMGVLTNRSYHHSR